jgi:predicted dehydrogenase
MKNTNTSRRAFIQKSTVMTAAAISAPAVQKALGANDTINVGFIGVGNRGSQLLQSFMKNDDMRIAALCDVYKPYRERSLADVDPGLKEMLGGRIPRMNEEFEYDIPRYADYREVLERNDIDAVVVATPDHWHAIITIEACEAGKDVYCEKPLSVTVTEGRHMINAAKRTNRVVQVGLHRRSSELYHRAHELMQSGAIGKVTVSRAYRISNMFPNGIGSLQPKNPIKDFDWNMWLGPRADRDYQDNISPYKFRWWVDYSSQMANWGVHYCDAIRWVLDEEAPVSVCAMGGKFALHDDRTVPDTMEVIFELPGGSLLVFGQYEANGGKAIEQGELEFRGTLGNMYTGVNDKGIVIEPTSSGQFQTREDEIETQEINANKNEDDMTDQHTRNFLDCVKSRKKTNCDLETGHRSTTFALLANMSLATRSRLDWDAKTERVTNNDAANELLEYEYRKPWKVG